MDAAKELKDFKAREEKEMVVEGIRAGGDW